MNSNLTIECRQKNASSVYNNGDYNSKIPQTTLYEGDILTIDKVFVDTEAQNDVKVHIEEDINVKMDVFLYNFNWNTPQDGSSNDNVKFDTVARKNDGFEYIMASQTPQYTPKNANYTFYTQLTVEPNGVSNYGSYGGQALACFYIDIDGNQATFYFTPPDTTLSPHEPSSFSIVVPISVYAKTGGMGSAGISGTDNSFSIANPSVWNSSKCDQSSLRTTGEGQIQHDILTPRIFTKTFKLLSGKYEPNDLATTINNNLTENANLDNQGFSASTVIESPFLKQSVNQTQTTETYIIAINRMDFVTDSTEVQFFYTVNHTYMNGQPITIAGLPNSTFAGIPLNNFNGSKNISDWSQTIDTLHGGTFTLDQATEASETRSLFPNICLYVMVFTNGSGVVRVTYMNNEDPGFTNGMSVRIFTNKNTTFAGIDTTAKIDNVSHTISNVGNFDTNTLRGEFDITLTSNATADGTLGFRQLDNPLTGANPSGLGFIVPNNTANGGNITTTETISDNRFLTRYDGLAIKQFSQTFGSNTPAGNYWIGASQMELQYDDPTDRFKWVYTHSPIYDSNKLESIGIKKDATAPTPANPYFYANRDGGVIFHSLSATKDDGSIYDFWEAKLGFVINNLCMDYNLEIKSLGTGQQHIPVFNKPSLGKHITGQRPTLDSLITKGTGFQSVGDINSFPDTDQDLTTEIIADNITIDNNAWRFGYFYIEVQGGFTTEMLGEDGLNGIEVRNNLMAVISNYYSLGGFTSSSGGGAIYRHTGQPLVINNLRIRILTSEKILDTRLGDDNTVFFTISRGEMAQMINSNFKGKN